MTLVRPFTGPGIRFERQEQIDSRSQTLFSGFRDLISGYLIASPCLR